MEKESQQFESVESMPKQEMVILVKPDAFFRLDEILQRLRNENIEVIGVNSLMLTPQFVNKIIYNDSSNEVKFETAKHFNSGPSTVILVEGGQDLIEKINEIVGIRTNPIECSPDSLRYMFGEHEGRELPSGGRYFRNAIHRAKNKYEANRDLEVLKGLIV